MLGHAKVFRNRLHAQSIFLLRNLLFQTVTGYLAADRSNGPLKVTYPGFPGIAADNLQDSMLGKMDIIFFKSVCLQLFREQKAFCNLKLFLFRIAVETNNLHPILQRQGNSVQVIGRGNKKDLGKIIVQIKVMIIKGVVLLRIQNLKQS